MPCLTRMQHPAPDNRETVLAIRVFDACSGLPQFLGDCERVDLTLLPPPPLIARCVIFAVVDGAERHGEFVAHFECKPSRLRVADMMGVRWGTAANDAWLRRDKAKVLL